MKLPPASGGYGLRELRYAAPFADALVDDPDFRTWVLSRTKFAKYSLDARVLDREMLAKRSAKAASWWRSHFREKCRCDGCSGRETDLLAIFESPGAFRFALHVEVKNPRDKFTNAKQARSYQLRAKCWCANPPLKVLPHADAGTALLFSEEKRMEFSPYLEFFETLITFQEIASSFPHFGSGIYSTAG
jgi:hypothetical protein